MDSKQLKVVYTIVERPPSPGAPASERDKPKGIWLKIGIGSVNRDGSLNLKLDALPVNGQIHVRDYVASEDRLDPSLPGQGGSGSANGRARLPPATRDPVEALF